MVDKQEKEGRISSIEVFMAQFPFKKPINISYTSYNSMDSIIVKIYTENGYFGYGEGTPDQHVTGETVDSVYNNIKNNLAPTLIGERPEDIEKIHDLMNKTINKAPTAKAALDIACFDLVGKKLKAPTYTLLGGRFHDNFPLTYVLSIDTHRTMANEALSALEEGYQIIKIKVGQNAITDIKRIKNVAQSINNRASLRIDANQGWESSDKTIEVLSSLKGIKIDWLEQPVDSNNIDELQEVRKRTNVPIMADESLLDVEDMRTIIDKKAATKVNIKLMKCGGIYPALKILALAESSKIECQIGSMVESSVGSAAGYQIAFSKKIINSVELTGPLKFSKDIGNLYYDIPLFKLNSLPGLGIDIDEKNFKSL